MNTTTTLTITNVGLASSLLGCCSEMTIMKRNGMFDGFGVKEIPDATVFRKLPREGKISRKNRKKSEMTIGGIVVAEFASDSLLLVFVCWEIDHLGVTFLFEHTEILAFEGTSTMPCEEGLATFADNRRRRGVGDELVRTRIHFFYFHAFFEEHLPVVLRVAT